MLSRFFSRGVKDAKVTKPPTKEAKPPRGLEVIEDDPDTAWGLWDNALAEQESQFPTQAHSLPTPQPAVHSAALRASERTWAEDISDLPTQPMGLEELTPEQRKDAALSVVESHHQRIANTIRTLWGHKECSDYINKLIMNGGDGMGHARIGFNQDAAEAMLVLTDLHDALFGSAIDDSLDFTNLKRNNQWGHQR